MSRDRIAPPSAACPSAAPGTARCRPCPSTSPSSTEWPPGRQSYAVRFSAPAAKILDTLPEHVEDTAGRRMGGPDRRPRLISGSRDDPGGARGCQPVRELLQKPVVQQSVTKRAGVAAGVEETCVVDDAAGGYGQGVETVQEGELVVVRVAESDELPEQRQAGCFAQVAFGGGLAGGSAAVWSWSGRVCGPLWRSWPRPPLTG